MKNPLSPEKRASLREIHLQTPEDFLSEQITANKSYYESENYQLMVEVAQLRGIEVEKEILDKIASTRQGASE